MPRKREEAPKNEEEGAPGRGITGADAEARTHKANTPINNRTNIKARTRDR